MRKLALLAGDGIGPEIIKEALNVLDAISDKSPSFQYEVKEALIGGIAIDNTGTALPEETVELCKDSDAVLLGAVGGPKWDNTDPGGVRPEQGLLGIRKELGLFANLRPVKIFDALIDSSTLKPEYLKDVDIMVVRELTGGIYFGERKRVGDRAYDTCDYTFSEIERLLRIGFDLAVKRGGKVHSIDKANVLESSRLWREVAVKVHADYPEIELSHMLVDNCAMQLIRNPAQFDVIATSNMFGDILSDEASMLTGSLGMLASASLGSKGVSLYEPSHGSAPDIAGQNIANPIATIMSVSLMLRYSFDLMYEADIIDKAIEDVLDDRFRTADIMEDGATKVTTAGMGEKIVASIKKI